MDIVYLNLHGFVAFASWTKRVLALQRRFWGCETHRSGASGVVTATTKYVTTTALHCTAARNEGWALYPEADDTSRCWTRVCYGRDSSAPRGGKKGRRDV